ncbi:hypothetical protein C3747_111g163 [Trypanosoma cruzi]|uniref:GRIP domain-containing protein n=2 Tax=Trypanosoma cruzi TaxID=5693 RepID=Q4DFN0_TRYCC|nr:hypothetical protein, conserved [Trypanosoma cruzi]EAN91330.1 hypothetical protein, conserved [Trypanosoma cruzi]PWV06710.1 hypothetical protein C3747_111g163 [Trypanosoma cruzi]RNC54461.1 hypothetical protein TcCL_ESM08108 [Trypanosoma cruzi]|eukprot:XP_813181.1 hypothetical protein [Trypanosoma cruzi strain CL Brener]
MWSNWGDVKRKIKDIAAEITQPLDEESEDAHEKEQPSGGGRSRPLREEPRPMSHAAPHSSRLLTVKNDSIYDHSGSLSTSRLGGYTAPPVRQAAPSDISTTPPSRLNNSSVHEESVERSRISSTATVDKTLSTPCKESEMGTAAATTSPAGTKNGGEAKQNKEEYIEKLEQQVRRLSEAKFQIEQQVFAYQEKVRESHKKTVEYYEQKMATLQHGISSEKALKEEFAEKLSQREKDCQELQSEVQELREQVKKFDDEATIIKILHDEMKKTLADREEECLEKRRQIESLQELHDALLERVEREKQNKDKTPMESVPIAHSDAHVSSHVASGLVVGDSSVAELRRRVEALEEEKVLMLREKEQMTALLLEERRIHRVTVKEREQILSHDREQAQRLAALVQRLENERQQERQNDREEEEKRGKMLTQQEEAAPGNGMEMERAAARNREELEKLTSSLEKEIVALRSQLETNKHEGEEAVHRVKAALSEEHARNMAAFVSQEEQRTRETIEKLQRELQDAQQHGIELERRREKLWEEVQQLKDRLKQAHSDAETLSNKLIVAETQVEELQFSLQEARHATEGNEASLVCALTARKKELETTSARQKELLQQLEHTITDCLVRTDTDLPPPREGVGASFSDKVILLVSEFNRLFSENQKAAQLQKEWERTYEQARGVNGTLSQQVSEAWKTIGVLREDLSIRDQSFAKLKQQLQAESQQRHDAQHTLTVITNELHGLKEEKRAWETRIGLSSDGKANHQEQLNALEADVETLRRNLLDREEELSQAQSSLETLQQVLDTFTQNKTRDVEERTADMQIEIDQLRTQLLEAEKRQHHHQADIDALAAGHMREIAAKNAEITSLHRKHAEIRKALDETARQLNGTTMIDKRVISHLTVNFIHAFVGKRREADEMLKVLSGLLNWDEEMQEKAGLLPGPSNPKPGHQRKGGGLIGGLVKTVWGGPGRGARQEGGDSGTSPSIAELWVEFLMRESEAGTIQGDAASVNTTSNASTLQIEDVIVTEGDGSGVKSLTV